MTYLLRKIAAVALIAMIATSCQKENAVQPLDGTASNALAQGQVAKNGSLLARAIGVGDIAQVRNLKSDSIIPPASPAPFYYSLSTESKVSAVSASRALLLNGYFNADVNGVNGFTLGYIDAATLAYGSITAANAVANLTAAPNNKLGYNSATAGWYNYFFNDNHKVLPVVGRTLIAYKVSGATVTEIYKIKMLSIYKDMPANPTGTEPIPYLSFDYQRLQ
ncbi:hypothetical protein [Chitinophaga nivalis]|uniref:Uncharacterized protein n=1 Tax=Chitinophaga nivalis TaxID=2991709 RepID=A0ABT3IT88_9BACT|nr:hypothetical protein [Chitinophaga nivalis]MCW3463113.1 hypothetical protein [Chitinophaga nivalis]MCW3487197.1 hypothetical protein [Chitinophaga nivalis]